MIRILLVVDVKFYFTIPNIYKTYSNDICILVEITKARKGHILLISQVS